MYHHLIFDDLRGALQEEGLVGRHLVEDHTLDGGFATPTNKTSHKQPVGVC
jgi:hypothetical protein